MLCSQLQLKMESLLVQRLLGPQADVACITRVDKATSWWLSERGFLPTFLLIFPRGRNHRPVVTVDHNSDLFQNIEGKNSYSLIEMWKQPVELLNTGDLAAGNLQMLHDVSFAVTSSLSSVKGTFHPGLYQPWEISDTVYCFSLLPRRKKKLLHGEVAELLAPKSCYMAMLQNFWPKEISVNQFSFIHSILGGCYVPGVSIM